MKRLTGGLQTLAEKFLDPVLNLGALDLLGVSVPDHFTGVGAIGVLAATNNISNYIRDIQFERDFAAFTAELDSITVEQKIDFYQKYSKKRVKDFGDQVILLLGKIEMPLAAKLMGRAHYDVC